MTRVFTIYFVSQNKQSLTTDELTQMVAKHEKDNDMKLQIQHSIPKRSFREYTCNTHNDCKFFCRFGPAVHGKIMIKAKCYNLTHQGTMKSKLSVDGKRKLKQRVKGVLKETLEKVVTVKNDDPIPKDVVKAAANGCGEKI
jgi:hypothetical protein